MKTETSMHDLAPPQTKAELLIRIDQAWDDVATLVARASNAQLLAAGPDGGWSVKDHLSHLTVWEGRLLAFLQGRTFADYFGPDPAAVDSSIDGLNAFIVERDRARTPEDVVQAWREVHLQVLEALHQLSDDDLKAPRPDPDNPDDIEPLLGSGVLDGNTYQHYAEHGTAIRLLLPRSSSSDGALPA